MILTRRHVLTLATAGVATLPRLYASGDVWNKKPPAEWTSEDIDRLLTKSPWAKEVTADYAPGEGGYGDEGGTQRSGGGYPGGGGGTGRGPSIGIGGIGMPRRGGIGLPGGVGLPGGGGSSRGGGGHGRQGGGSAFKGIVRWESARPIQEAQKSELPDMFKDHYVIGVSGIPLLNRRDRRPDDDDQDTAASQKEALENAKNFTTIAPKGRDLAQAGIAWQQPSSSHIFLFGFSRQAIELSADDKEVLFHTRLGGLIVKAKFDLKEMKYQGKLAL
jgi:hypothetical protein